MVKAQGNMAAKNNNGWHSNGYIKWHSYGQNIERHFLSKLIRGNNCRGHVVDQSDSLSKSQNTFRLVSPITGTAILTVIGPIITFMMAIIIGNHDPCRRPCQCLFFVLAIAVLSQDITVT